jgi:hypothetical protein
VHSCATHDQGRKRNPGGRGMDEEGWREGEIVREKKRLKDTSSRLR